MYRHRIIDDMRGILADALHMPGGAEAARTLESVQELLLRCSELYVGDYANFREAQQRAREEFEFRELADLPLPFESGPVLVTYRLETSDEDRRLMAGNGFAPAPRRAVLLHRTEEFSMVFAFHRLENSRRWTISPVMFVAWPGDARVSFVNFSRGVENARDTPEARDLIFELAVLMFCIKVATCGNIRLRFVAPDADRLNRKRARGGRAPVVGHYALARLEGDVIIENISLCGGHYKTYTADAPLFGRHVGRWWWPAHVRTS